MRMKRVEIGRISELSGRKFYQGNNVLINFYLDGFEKREKNKEKPLIVFINYITIFSYILCIIKYLAGFSKLSYTTKLILFDVASLVGGIELYNRILFLCGLIAGLSAQIIFRWSKSNRHREWTEMFELTRSREPHKLVKDKSQMDDLKKLVKAMRWVYRIWTSLFLFMSKISLKL